MFEQFYREHGRLPTSTHYACTEYSPVWSIDFSGVTVRVSGTAFNHQGESGGGGAAGREGGVT